MERSRIPLIGLFTEGSFRPYICSDKPSRHQMDKQYPKVDLPPVKILLVDDHVLLNLGMYELLKKLLPEAKIAFETTTEAARKRLQETDYTFLLTDYHIPGENVDEFIRDCRKTWPSLLILVVSGLSDLTVVKRCLQLKANGFVSKSVNDYELKMALERIYRGEVYISSDLTGRLAASFLNSETSELTRKEMDVLLLVAKGKNVKAIAEELFISPSTVMSHRSSIMRKLNVRSAAELVRYAYENNLI